MYLRASSSEALLSSDTGWAIFFDFVFEYFVRVGRDLREVVVDSYHAVVHQGLEPGRFIQSSGGLAQNIYKQSFIKICAQQPMAMLQTIQLLL